MQNANNAEGQANAHPPADNAGSNPGQGSRGRVKPDVEMMKNKLSSLADSHFWRDTFLTKQTNIHWISPNDKITMLGLHIRSVCPTLLQLWRIWN